MSNELTTMPDEDLIKTLQSSVYVDCSREIINLVLSYCKAYNIDPMIKPFHVVKFKEKETLLPSIALHRIRSHRSGTLLGIGEPQYGEEITEKVGNDTVTFPKKCNVTIRKLVNGQIAEFVGSAIWKESYQTINDKRSPNVFWLKRPFSQLYKCAEADGLKRAYPEIAGNQITIEEYNPDFNPSENVTNQVGHDPSLAITKTTEEIKAQFINGNNVTMVAKDDSQSFDVIDVKTGEVLEEHPNKDELLTRLKCLIAELNMTQSELDEIKKYAALKNFSEAPRDKLIEIINALSRRLMNGKS